MKPSLRHPLIEQRRAHRSRHGRRPTAQESAAKTRESAATTQVAAVPAQRPAVTAHEPDVTMQGPDAAAQRLDTAAQRPDTAARRVREAGGPSDQASYACECGLLFAASVSTTVECPHCGTAQAW